MDGNRNPRKMKTCFSCGREGRLNQDEKCPARGQAHRKCGTIGHFKVKCPQLYQRGGAQSGFKGTRNSRGGHRRGSRGAGGFSRGGRGRGGLGREANRVTGGSGPGEEDNGDFATPVQ